MIRRILPIIAALAVVALILGPGRQYLPSALRLQTGGALVSGDGMGDMDMAQGHPSGIGLAPAPVVNPPAAAARMRVAVKPAEKTARGYVLGIQVSAADGKALVDAPVRFYDIVDLFGAREMYLGTAQTDGSGAASLEYLPATAGAHQIVARVAGRDAVKAGEARTTFDATVTAPARSFEQRPFASFSDRVPYAAGLLVLAVWGLIAFALIATARGVVAGAQTRGKEGHA